MSYPHMTYIATNSHQISNPATTDRQHSTSTRLFKMPVVTRDYGTIGTLQGMSKTDILISVVFDLGEG